jgi:histidine triad (HIT) family protein
MDCIFCKIVSGEIPSQKVYEDDRVLAFKDINPAAPIHIVIIPKEHISSTNDLNDANKDIVGHIFKIAALLAKENGISERGYRIVNNCGEEGGQSVKHLHFHLLGGRNLQWPPG